MRIADQQLQRKELTDEELKLTQQLASLIFVICTFSKKGQQLFQKLGIIGFFCQQTKIYMDNLSDRFDLILQVCLSVIEKLA